MHKGYQSRNIQERISYLKVSQKTYPYYYPFRISPSIEYSKLAINNNSVEFGKYAIKELNEALLIDLYSPELLAPAAIINYGFGNVDISKTYLKLFKHTAKKSDYLNFMKGY